MDLRDLEEEGEIKRLLLSKVLKGSREDLVSFHGALEKALPNLSLPQIPLFITPQSHCKFLQPPFSFGTSALRGSPNQSALPAPGSASSPCASSRTLHLGFGCWSTEVARVL
ncbi:hypothetical protein LEMLEM_LOCUS12260 [Lemmus lemmus]